MTAHAQTSQNLEAFPGTTDAERRSEMLDAFDVNFTVLQIAQMAGLTLAETERGLDRARQERRLGGAV